MTLAFDNLPWHRREKASNAAEAARANAGVDVFDDFRRELASGEDPIVPRIVGPLFGDDLDEYKRLMQQAFRAGYTIQRHPLEQWGEVGTAPMLIRRAK